MSKPTKEKGPGDIFIDVLIAAMLDAVQERKLTQLKSTITPPGRTTPQYVRIIVVPETMDVEWTKPLGT